MDQGCCLPVFSALGRGGPPDGRTPLTAAIWAAFVTLGIPEILTLAHPDWIPAVSRSLAKWVRGSFEFTGNSKKKETGGSRSGMLDCPVKEHWRRPCLRCWSPGTLDLHHTVSRSIYQWHALALLDNSALTFSLL